MKIFRKIKLPAKEQKTLTLPLIEAKDFTPDKIREYLINEIPILAVTDPKKKTQIDGHWSFEMLIGVEMNGLKPSVSMYRKEGPFICQYRAYKFDEDPTFHFILSHVYEFKNSNIMELYNNELREAVELYHDDEKVVETQNYYAHDFTVEEGLEFFAKNPKARSLYIGKERLILKNNTEEKNEWNQ